MEVKNLVAMFFTGLCEEQLHGWLLRSSQDFVKGSITDGCYDIESLEIGDKKLIARLFTGFL